MNRQPPAGLMIEKTGGMRVSQNTDRPLLSVYGSLRRGYSDGIHPLLKPAEFVGKGSFAGTLYDLGEYPGAIAVQNSSGRVFVEVYFLLEPKIIWPRLDDYEGFDPEQIKPALFRRTTLNISLVSGEDLRTWVYLYNRPTETLHPIKSGEWIPFS